MDTANNARGTSVFPRLGEGKYVKSFFCLSFVTLVAAIILNRSLNESKINVFFLFFSQWKETDPNLEISIFYLVFSTPFCDICTMYTTIKTSICTPKTICIKPLFNCHHFKPPQPRRGTIKLIFPTISLTFAVFVYAQQRRDHCALAPVTVIYGNSSGLLLP